MKGDFSRQTFDPARHFSGVRMQQGRVQLDADWNEQVDLARHRVETETGDTVGHCGGPLHDAGFRIVPLAGAPNDVKNAVKTAYPSVDPNATNDLVILPGRYYVNGVLAVCEAPVLFGAQPDLPRPLPPQALNPAHGLQPGDYVLYLDVWDRHVTALENPALRERALGGPDTATRTRTVWQVGAFPYLPQGGGGMKPEPCGPVPAFDAFITEAVRTLRARSQPAGPDQGPCVVPAGAGYRGLENQLYRVEVHAPGAADGGGGADVVVSGVDAQDPRIVLVPSGGGWAVGQTVLLYPTLGSSTMRRVVAQVAAVQEPAAPANPAKLTLSAPFTLDVATDAPHLRRVAGATWKWSRDNGIAVAGVSAVSGDGLRVTVDSLGQDEVLGFRMGDWVELTDDYTELRGLPGRLAVVERLDTAEREVVLRTPFPGLAVNTLDFDHRTPRLRRWDGIGIVQPGGQPQGYHALEDGVEVRFDGGPFRTGDYWLIPARAATAEDEGGGNVEWPAESATQGAPRAPAGIRHHVCRLGTVHVPAGNGEAPEVQDCRCLFAPLTEVRALSYVGGAGQEAMPLWAQADPRPELGLPLVVGVGNGHCRTEGRVRFRVAKGDGDVSGQPGAYPAGGRTEVHVPIDGQGMARCWWRLETDEQHQEVVATLQERVSLDPTDASDGAWMDVPGPVLFNASLSVASEVAYVPDGDCRMAQAQPPVATVQEALDWLCARTGGCSGLTVSPGDGWYEQVMSFLERNTRGDVDICFRAGRYPLERPLVVRGFRNVSFHGVGPATRFEADGLERALRFEACEHVAVRGFFASTGITAGEMLKGEPPNGTLSFVECHDVVAEELVLRCAAGTRRDAACLVAMNADSRDRRVPRTSITVRGCEAQVGDRQIGILVVNPGRAVVADNQVRVWGYPVELDLKTALARRGYVAFLQQILDGLDPPLEVREGWSLYLGPWWREWHDGAMEHADPLEMADTLKRYGIRTDGERLDAGTRLRAGDTGTDDAGTPFRAGASAGRVDDKRAESTRLPVEGIGKFVAFPPGGGTVPRETLQFLQWIARLETVAEQGIVVGGGMAGDVTVRGNVVEGVLQGVHIGLSHHRARGEEPAVIRPREGDTVQRAVVSGNSILVHVPFEVRQARHGIFIGNCHSALVEGNRAASSNTGLHAVARGNHQETSQHYHTRRGGEGIRAFGYYGPMLLIRDNHLEDFTIGILVAVLNAPAADSTKGRSRLWRVAHNVASHAFADVVVEEGAWAVELDGNVLAD